MDHTPISSTPTRDVFYYLAASALFILILAGTWWYTRRNTKPLYPVFNSAKQFIPKGAESRDVDQSLAAFGFSKPLPFFEKENVVQSLSLDLNASSSAAGAQPQQVPKIYLGYRIFGQSTAMVREMYRNYFQELGWKEGSGTKNNLLLVFMSPDMRRQASIELFEIATDPDKKQKTIVAVFSMLTFPSINPNINPRSIKQ